MRTIASVVDGSFLPIGLFRLAKKILCSLCLCGEGYFLTDYLSKGRKGFIDVVAGHIQMGDQRISLPGRAFIRTPSLFMASLTAGEVMPGPGHTEDDDVGLHMVGIDGDST